MEILKRIAELKKSILETDQLVDDLLSSLKAQQSKIDKKEKKIFSIYPGSRLTEVNTLLPILFNFIKLMNERHKDILFIFHCTSDYSQLIKSLLLKEELKN